MKKTLTLIALILLVCACNKKASDVETDPYWDNAKPGDVVLAINSSASVEITSKATATPVWEKKLTDIHVFIAKRTKSQAVSDNDKVVSHTAFGSTALAAQKMVISLSNALDDPNAAFTFYAVANDGSNSAMTTIISKLASATDVTRKDIINMVESGTVGQYNSATYEPVSVGAIRTKGFVMSGVDDNAGAGYELDPEGPIKVNLTIKRTAAKLNITTLKSANFALNYPKWTTPSGIEKTPDLRVTKIIVKEQLNNSNIFTQKTTAQSGAAAEFTQTSSIDNSGLNLFYIYEQTSAVKLEVYADFALDGDFTNTANDNLVVAGPYKIDLTGGAVPAFVRNTCYNVKINLDGLSGNQISTNINVEDWQVTTDQEINVGK